VEQQPLHVAQPQPPLISQSRARDQLLCGINTAIAGLAQADSQGKWVGLDVDVCRRPPSNASPRCSRARSTCYDGQGFMVSKKLGVKSAKELNGATVCVQPGTTTELNLADYFRTNKMTFKPVVIEKVEEVRVAFFSGRCDVYTTDAANAPNPDDDMVLPEIISKEPLAPAVRLKSENPSIKRIHGVTPGMGKALGIDEAWVVNIIKQVGNYGESFERNVGSGSTLEIDRGLNKLWTQGGIRYAPPIR
jgi:general L-amino acid transport system substrate-binding protein